jgi:hypothetical protein
LAKVRKIKKYLLFLLMGIMGLLLLVFLSLNLPFSQRYATRQVNQILTGTSLPIHLDAIGKILPGSVRIQGISITGPGGDTLIYTGELQADIRLLSLFRHKVVLKKLELDAALVELSRKSTEQKLNIAEAFGGGKNRDLPPGERPPGKWVISIRKGRLSNIQFRMNDSISGIHIAQDASLIAMEGFDISLPRREIDLGSLVLEDADGGVHLAPRLEARKERKGSPWNLGFQKLSMENMEFGFSSALDSIDVRTGIGKGSIRANDLDLVSRKADIKKISLDEGMLEIHGQKVFYDLVLHSEDLRVDAEQAMVKLRKIAFEMDKGFSLTKLSGELDSRGGKTQLQADIRTGNSRLGLKASAEESFWDILSDPTQMAGATLDLEKAKLALKDLVYFLPQLEDWPMYSILAASEIEMETTLDMDGPSMEVSGLSISQARNFNITLEGDMLNMFDLPLATGNMQLSVSDLNQGWMEELAIASGFTRPLPDLSDLKFEGSINDSLLAPEISLTLNSHWGHMDILASMDVQKKLFNLAYSLEEIALGDLLAVTELGSFTGAGEIKGFGFSADELQASFYMQIDSLDYKDYSYNNFQLTGAIEPGTYGIQMVANDPFIKGDMQLDLELADSVFILQASGLTHFDASLINTGQEVETEFHGSDLTLSTPRKTAVVHELNAYFMTDSTSSRLQADADFFDADLHLVKPLNELDSLGKGYQHYFASFKKASHITAANRVSVLPEIHATASISYHDLLDVFMGDSSLHFSRLDASISRLADANKLRTTVSGTDLSYKFLETDRMHAEITDSAGVLLLDILADSTSLLSGPEHKLMLRANSSKRNLLASLFVDDYGDQDLYLIEVAGRADSNQIFLEVPDQHLILNGTEWQLEDPDLLSIDLAGNSFFPKLRMKRDSSYLYILAHSQDSIISYALEMNQVEMTSLIRKDLIKGNPDGSFTGVIEYRTDRNTDKEISTDLMISELNFYGEDYRPIRLDGVFHKGASDSYLVNMHASTDSLEIIVNGKRNEEGERAMSGQFTRFPLVLIEPLSEKYISEVGGSLSGNFDLSSERGRERFTGQLMFHDAEAKVNLLNNVFRIPDQEIVIAEQKAIFNDFLILDTLERPLKVDGAIELRVGQPPVANLNITSSELQVMSRDRRRRVPFSGNVFVDSRISVSGPLTRPDIRGNIHLSAGSEIYYNHMEDLRMTETEKIINFVSHSTGVEEFQSPVLSGQGKLGRSSIDTDIEIDPSTKINFTLAKRMFNILLNVQGGGNIQYNLENDQMMLTGRYEIGEGTTLLKLVGWPDKSFRLAEGGFIRWDGMVENPELGIEAESKVSTSYVNPIDGKNRDIDFYVILRLTGYLEDLNVLFTLRTPDQYVMSVINTLSPEEQMRQAMSVLLFESIDLPGLSSSTDYMTAQVNQILSSQLNSLTKSTIKGVDISFGLDTYDQSSQDGSSESTTSLSYEVRKTFLNNRAHIEFSGRLKDANQESTTTDHSLNNLSFEYTLDSAATKYLKIYNEHTYDDVFEGEVIHTGIGFSYRKRYKSVKDIWRRKR